MKTKTDQYIMSVKNIVSTIVMDVGSCL